MTEVEFFFDPSCPWTWGTSRWLATVGPHRGLDITWRTWSLPINNAGQGPADDMPEDRKARHRDGQAFSRRALRVLEAVSADDAGDRLGRPGRVVGHKER